MASRPRTLAFWRRVVREYEASGLTQAEFARQRDVSAKSLQRWRSRLLPELHGGPLPAVVEVVLDAPSVTPGLADDVGPIVLRLGRALELEFRGGTAPDYLAAVGAALLSCFTQ